MVTSRGSPPPHWLGRCPSLRVVPEFQPGFATAVYTAKLSLSFQRFFADRLGWKLALDTPTEAQRRVGDQLDGRPAVGPGPGAARHRRGRLAPVGPLHPRRRALPGRRRRASSTLRGGPGGCIRRPGRPPGRPPSSSTARATAELELSARRRGPPPLRPRRARARRRAVIGDLRRPRPPPRAHRRLRPPARPPGPTVRRRGLAGRPTSLASHHSGRRPRARRPRRRRRPLARLRPPRPGPARSGLVGSFDAVAAVARRLDRARRRPPSSSRASTPWATSAGPGEFVLPTARDSPEPIGAGPAPSQEPSA